MKPSPNLRAEMRVERWSGHGEGGEIAKVVIVGGNYDIYHSSPAQIEQARVDADYVNSLLRAADQSNSVQD